MRTGVMMLAGLAVWALHFTGLYAIASLEDLLGGQGWRLGGAGFSLLCLALCGGVLARALTHLRRPEAAPARFTSTVAAVGAGLGLVSVAWQSLVLVRF